MLLDPPAQQAKHAPPYDDASIIRRIEACPKLGSLQSINRALNALLNSDHSLNSQIAEIIRRDPSLAARLLRMVNSVYFGLSTRVNNIEEAVFFLGSRQIRELAMATPVIEELERMQSKSTNPLPWKELWSHSIGTALLTREILSSASTDIDDDTDYLVGLLHNVGKVVMATAFPDELSKLLSMKAATPTAFAEMERKFIGWDHARIGAYFLGRHQIAEEIIQAVRYHNNPSEAPGYQNFAAAVQVADHLVRHAGINSGFETIDPIVPDSWKQLEGWKILYGEETPQSATAEAALNNALQRLPALVQGLVQS